MSKAEDFLKVSLDEANILASTNKVLGSPICLEGGRMIIPYSSVKVCHLVVGLNMHLKTVRLYPLVVFLGETFKWSRRAF